MPGCPVTTTRVFVASCILLALYTVVWFSNVGFADIRYFPLNIVGRPVSAGGHAPAECNIAINPNSVTESIPSDVPTTVSDESHPEGPPTLQSSSVINSTTGVPTTNKSEVTDTALTARRDIDIDTEPVPGQRHIVFLETRCVLHDSTPGNHSGLAISKREACAVASAANTNPDTTVYLLYTCPIVGTLSDSPEYVKQMLSYPNVRIWKLVVADLIKGTPLEHWDFMEKIGSSSWPVVHASDILRYTAIWKYGGTYLDLDFVVQKSLDGLGTNYVVAQTKEEMANGAFNFDMDAVGRTVAHLCLMDIQKNFNGQLWVQNGPWVLLRVLQTLCGSKRVTDMTRKQCGGFAVLPPSVFYEITYPCWRLFFDESLSKMTLQKVRGSYGVHVWNRMSSGEKVTVGTNTAYGLLAEKHCPSVYWNSGLEF